MSPYERISHRYGNAVPGSSKLEEVGVIIHFADGFEDPGRPWAGCAEANPQCGFLGDRISASIVYKGQKQSGVTFADNKGATYLGTGGVIYNPKVVRLLCAYGQDGATRGKICKPPGPSEMCIPACISKYDGHDALLFYEKWCTSLLPQDYHCQGHPWKPDSLGTMLEREREAQEAGVVRGPNLGYNEAVIDGWHSNANLPSSVEAFLAVAGEAVEPVRKAHQAFLTEYGLKPWDVPLLIYHPEHTESPGAVFELDEQSAAPPPPPTYVYQHGRRQAE